MSEKLGHNIRRERESRQLTQEELGKIIGVSKQTISSWENNDKRPRVDKLNSLAELFNTTVDTLLEQKIVPNKDDKYFKIAKQIADLEEDDRIFITNLIKKLSK